MFGTLALAAAILFVVLAIARLRPNQPSAIATAMLIAALCAGGFAGLHWSRGADSRWLVGGILMVAALAVSMLANNRGWRVLVIVLGGLGTALFAIATATARHL